MTAPTWAYAVAGRIIRYLPERLFVRLLPSGMRYVPESVPVAQPPEAAVRLLVTPMNFAGQGRLWAHAAVANIESVGAVNLAVSTGGFSFPADVIVPASAYAFSRSWHDREQEAALGFTHVVVEAERQPFGLIYVDGVAEQVRRLTVAGVRVAMLCHGSDIRLPSRHAAAETDSPFQPGLWTMTPVLERQARANRAMLDELGLPVFVSTPGLLADVPYGEWLPVVVDAETWRTDRRPLAVRIPVVAHAPSRGVIKGSDLIDPILRDLAEEGVIEYLRVDGVPAAQMPSVFGRADIVLDQFRLGDYGVAACEALAAGRVVVGHVSDDVRARVAARTGAELPIVQARARDVRDVVLDILARRDHYRQLAAAGPEFVAGAHDGRLSAAVLRPFLMKETTA